MIEIVRAKEMGFCFGVKEAVELAERLSKTYFEKRIFMLGMLVHNEYVIDKLGEKGVQIVEEKELLEGKDNLKKGDVVIVRAHGAIKSVYEELQKREVTIYDAACIFVTSIRETLIEKEKEGNEIIFIGNKNHPETKGIISFGKKVKVVADIEDLKKLDIDSKKKYVMLTQTTLNKNKFEEIREYVDLNYFNIEIKDKICGATYVRQRAVEELAKEVDLLLVVGGKNSSNTKKLCEISKNLNVNTYHIQDVTSLDRKWLEDIKKVGITAGASTPEEVVKKIEKTIRGTI